VADAHLRGKSELEKAQVLQWLGFADSEILPASCTWVFPCLGIMEYNKQVSNVHFKTCNRGSLHLMELEYPSQYSECLRTDEQGLIRGRDRGIFFLQLCPDWLWSTQPIVQRVHGHFPRGVKCGWVVKLTTKSYLLQRLRMSRNYDLLFFGASADFLYHT
jgi:hypothetical protein